MGYSSDFLRGILALIALGALAGLVLGAADELLGLGLFDGYPGGGGYGFYAARLGVIIAVSIGLSFLVDRLNR